MIGSLLQCLREHCDLVLKNLAGTEREAPASLYFISCRGVNPTVNPSDRASARGLFVLRVVVVVVVVVVGVVAEAGVGCGGGASSVVVGVCLANCESQANTGQELADGICNDANAKNDATCSHHAQGPTSSPPAPATARRSSGVTDLALGAKGGGGRGGVAAT